MGHVFMKLGDIKGPSLEENFEFYIPLETISLGFEHTGTPVEDTGHLIFNKFDVTFAANKASPAILTGLFKGSTFPKVEIHVTKSFKEKGKQPVVSYMLSQAMISEFAHDLAHENLELKDEEAEQPPTEALSLSFNKIEMKFTSYDEDGVETGFDVASGERG